MGKEMLARLGKQTNVCVCPHVLLGAWWWLWEGGWGLKNKSVSFPKGQEVHAGLEENVSTVRRSRNGRK